MPGVMDGVDYQFAQQHFLCDHVWKYFDGDSTSLKSAHECIDRHALDDARVTVRLTRAGGRDDALTFYYVAEWSSRFAHWLQVRGVGARERAAIILGPSLIFHAAWFGAMKRGAISLPLLTLFGPDGARRPVSACGPKVLLLGGNQIGGTEGLDGTEVIGGGGTIALPPRAGDAASR